LGTKGQLSNIYMCVGIESTVPYRSINK